MRGRLLGLAIAGLGLAAAPCWAQASPSNAALKATSYTPPRTAWGDPDLTGTYTNKYEVSAPLERPDEFEGRRLEDIKPAELKEILQQRQQQTIDRLPYVSGDPEGRIGPPPETREIYSIEGGSRAWLIVDPPDGKIPPLTAEGRKRAADRAAVQAAHRRVFGAFDSVQERSLYDRCITRGLPGSMMPAIYGNSYRIVQGPGYVAIIYEMVHEARVIPLDNRPHVGAPIRSYMGNATGHFDGNTLVVETTNFKEQTAYRGADPDTLKLIERFTPTAPNKVEWSVTVNDPSTWTRPWTFSLPLTKDEHEAVFEYACHEGNYALANMLSAARAEEKQAAEGASAK
jgi:hypothetical protein